MLPKIRQYEHVDSEFHAPWRHIYANTSRGEDEVGNAHKLDGGKRVIVILFFSALVSLLALLSYLLGLSAGHRS